MLTTVLASLLLAPQPAPVQVASAQQPAVVAEEAAQANTDDKDSDDMICRRSVVQRAGLVSKSRKVCRTAAEWKVAAAR